MQKQTESIRQPKEFNPSALLQLANAGEDIHFEVTDIGDEQCVVAQVSELTPALHNIFEGSRTVVAHNGSIQPGKAVNDVETRLDWQEWSNALESAAGSRGMQIQTAMAGKTGRLKEIQVGLFDLQNNADLMQALHDLNDAQKANGVEPHEGVPENIAYLPENLLRATTKIRKRSAEEGRAVNESVRRAKDMGAVALPAFSGRYRS